MLPHNLFTFIQWNLTSTTNESGINDSGVTLLWFILCDLHAIGVIVVLCWSVFLIYLMFSLKLSQVRNSIHKRATVCIIAWYYCRLQNIENRSDQVTNGIDLFRKNILYWPEFILRHLNLFVSTIPLLTWRTNHVGYWAKISGKKSDLQRNSWS